jgi:uncharacterized protein (TIGR02145 family)
LVGAAALFAVCLAGCRGNSGTIPGGGGGGNNTGGNNCTGAEACKTVTIGGHVWLAENLNIQTTDSWCYGEGGQVYDRERGKDVMISSDEADANCAKYGRLYAYDAAKSACELLGGGWHLPSREEWRGLVRAVDPEAYLTDGLDYGNVAGTKLKTRTGWDSSCAGYGTCGEDTYGFSALPGGYGPGGYGTLGNFCNAGSNGYWWTATENESSNAYYREMSSGEYVDAGVLGKDYGLSVRCRGD